MDTTTPTQDATTAVGVPIVDRSKSAPYLIRVFVKTGGFHRVQAFEEGAVPTGDEQQIFTWKDATLREVLTTLRDSAPPTTEFRHPLARYAFRAVFADPTARGRFASKELGSVHARDVLGDLGALDNAGDAAASNGAPETHGDDDEDMETGEPRVPPPRDTAGAPPKEKEASKDARTLEELRFSPGDYMCVSVILPKGAMPGAPGELSIKGSAVPGGPPSAGWKSAGASASPASGWPDGPRRASDLGPAGPPSAGLGRGGGGGGHWRGRSGVEAPVGRGGPRGGRGDFGRREDDERDRRIPPPRRERDRDSPPPPRRGGGGYGRGGRGGRSRSRSRSPPRRR